MFDKLTLRGTSGTLYLGPYATAATVGAWTLTKDQQQWRLAATLNGRLDVFMVRQHGLLFTAPHLPTLDVVGPPTIIDRRLTAILKVP